MTITIYKAICKDKNGDCFTVNGGWKDNKEDAVSIARKHTACVEIVRVDSEDADLDEWLNPNII